MNKFSKLQCLLLAGVCGGLAEVIWISLYSLITNAPLASIGTAIATTAYPASSELVLAPVLGIVIHMSLSVLLALGFGLLIWPIIDRVMHFKQAAMIASVITLAIVWKINFFVLLPVWNPEFIGLLPLSITLVSKLLFGVAMGMVLTLTQQKSIA